MEERKDKLDDLSKTLRKAIGEAREGDITILVAAMNKDRHTYGANGTQNGIAELLLLFCDDDEYGEDFADTILDVAKVILAKRRMETSFKGKAEA